MMRIFWLLFLFQGALLSSCVEGHQHQEQSNTNEEFIFEIEADQTQGLTSDETLDYFFENEKSDEQVFIEAEIIKVLPDDNEGSRHQKFIVELLSGQTILVAHNIDLAPRVKDLTEHDVVFIYGEYEWSEKGGVIHWTHHDPDGDHEGGWIKHNGIVYE